jgi:phage terminase large subunit-like protein
MTQRLSELQLKKQYLRELEKRASLQDGLPHLYGYKFYKWQRKFWNSTNKYNFITAANQIGKSSVNIRKCIHWATNKDLWPKLWKKEPTQFWYFYPDAKLATVEFNEKFVKEYLPRGDFKKHALYGWEAEFDSRRMIHAIHFNSGVSVYFKTYEQKARSLQASTVFAVFVDEEMPPELFPEINMRLVANDGYWHMVFTATLGSQFWRETMEFKGKPEERFVGALKQQISMYDCLEYDDGSPSEWSVERIDGIKATCGSQAEIERRILGKFVKDTGLLIPHFTRARNVTQDDTVPADWYYISGVDPGSGGAKGHPSAIIVVAVAPDGRAAKVVRVRRLDGVETTAYDTLSFYKEVTANLTLVTQKYDWADKDFGILAEREGIPFIPAQKNRDFGFGILNSLFQTGILQIVWSQEAEKLIVELENLDSSTDKAIAKDDLCDALRYAVVGPSWAFHNPQILEPLGPVKATGRDRNSKPVEPLDLFSEDVENAQYEWDYLGY